MTRALTIKKWTVYALCGLFPIWLLDAYILSRYPIASLTPCLLPLTVVCVAILEGAYAGTGFGLAVGFLWTVAYPGTMSMRILLLALVGLFVGILAQYALRQSFPGYLLCSTATYAVLSAMNIFRELLIHRAPLSVLLGVGIGETILTLLWSPLIFFLFGRIFARVGGTRLS